jgi:hypothetical protein
MRAAMNFVLVNDGQPSHEAACSACVRPLRSGYVRHVPTRECYCDYECYRQRQLGVALMSWPFSQLGTVSTSESVAASRRLAVEAIAMSSSMAYWSCTAHAWVVLRSLTQAFLSAHELMTLEGGDK